MWPDSGTADSKIVSWLRRNGFICFRAVPHKKSHLKIGYPDIWGSLKGTARAFAIEVKFDNEQPTQAQNETLEEMHDCGWRVAVVREYREAIDTVMLWQEMEPLSPARVDTPPTNLAGATKKSDRAGDSIHVHASGQCGATTSKYGSGRCPNPQILKAMIQSEQE